MRNRIAAASAVCAIMMAGMAMATGVASAAGAPKGAHVTGEGYDLQQGVAWSKAQQQARSKCASNQVVSVVSYKYQTVAPLSFVTLVLVCG